MFERCIFFNTNALVRKINARWDRAFARFGLSPAHGYLLRLVLEKPGLAQQKIAEELQLNKSTVTRFIGALEDKQLIERTESGGDLRERIINPSRKALRIQKDLEALGDELYKSICDALGANNVKAFVTDIRALNDKLS